MWNVRFVVIICLLRNIVEKQHIAHRAARNGQQHLPPPKVENDGDDYCDNFRYTVNTAEKINISQAIDNEHTKNRGGQKLAL